MSFLPQSFHHGASLSRNTKGKMLSRGNLIPTYFFRKLRFDMNGLEIKNVGGNEELCYHIQSHVKRGEGIKKTEDDPLATKC